MTESERLELIKNAVTNANAKVAPEFKDLLAELKQEKLAEDLVLEHGLTEAKEQDVLDECEQLDSYERDEEKVDFDQDENELDMENLSPSMRELYT